MGSEKLDDTDGSLAEQVAVNTDNITRIFAEHERMRERMHVLESDRATVLLLAQKVDNLALALPAMVERAAEQTAEKIQAARSSDWRTWTAVFASLVSLAGFIWLVAHG